jgi:protein-L-isoaspartate(D-aspartate) O-methyltransferase
MVDRQIEARGISDPEVLDAMRAVERHLFVPREQQEHAYEDRPLPIGHGQTISQPYIVAFMTEAARLKPGDKVLEIGTGSGYQAAVLARVVKEVYTVEIIGALAQSARATLAQLGYQNIFVKHGDGYQGWQEYAPYDAIIVTAAPDEVPGKLLEQLAAGGTMVIPVGSFTQNLYRMTRTEEGIAKEALLPVRFVPMVEGKEKK